MKKYRWLLLLTVLALLICLGWQWLSWRMEYMPEPVFSLETPLFSGKRVMVLVPHQDDEVNLAGGVMEQYTRAGSRVFLVYATNGDYNGLAEERSLEALAAAEVMGIPEEDVYYLGYGNQWQPQGENTHIYFSPDGDALWTSHIGATETYGTEAIDCYAESAYTRNNFCRDLTALILELRPDVIYCSDYDPHHDHMALDLLFEEVLGEILVQEPDYRPTVYKGLCYGTAWYAEADFAGTAEPASSRYPDWEYWGRMGIPYDWSSRVRLPMGEENRSPILSENTVFRALSCFESQEGWSFAQSVLNGDKVFFQRRTDSLLYDAVFYAGQEPVKLWNDFKLKDSEEFSSLINSGGRFSDHITVRLPEPRAMNEIRLHTDPAGEGIYNGCIRLGDGGTLDFSAISADGMAVISFPEQTVSQFDVFFTDIQGEEPRLTEIEAFLTVSEPPQLLMALDENDNFVYDHWISEGETTELRLYAYPGGASIGWEDVKITAEYSWGCKWEVDEALEVLRVTCPPEGRVVITLSASENVSTTFTVSNPLPETRQDVLTRQAEDLAQIEALYGTE